MNINQLIKLVDIYIDKPTQELGNKLLIEIFRFQESLELCNDLQEYNYYNRLLTELEDKIYSVGQDLELIIYDDLYTSHPDYELEYKDIEEFI